MYSCRGSKIFPAFVGFLKSKDPADGTEHALLSELSVFNDYLKENVSLVLYTFSYESLCNFKSLIDVTDKFKIYMGLLELSLPTWDLDLLVVTCSH